ncbi:unnamed protein product [Meganyctiphanes norvegica]|uniref:Fibrinogen C-terminal domain-containing protein n=1 Tax=Meganyctiphanes norvegica TaxID=48144 RepID=A0AAV2S0P8_MEGNR
MIYCDENDGMKLLDEKNKTKQRAVATNCKDLKDQGTDLDGIYIMYPFADHPETPVLIPCDQTTQGGGWTVIIRRDESYPQTTEFSRSFEEYASGFGNVNYDFYIGNEIINSLTDSSINELWVEIEANNGTTGYAHYKYFHVGARDAHVKGEPTYMMDSGFYEGSKGEGLGYDNGMGFTTYDQDNDLYDKNCADGRNGWWHKDCHFANLNGPYGSVYFRWHTTENNYILSKAHMMVRPLST